MQHIGCRAACSTIGFRIFIHACCCDLLSTPEVGKIVLRLAYRGVACRIGTLGIWAQTVGGVHACAEGKVVMLGVSGTDGGQRRVAVR